MTRLRTLSWCLLALVAATQLSAVPAADATEVGSALVLDSPTGGDYSRTSRTYVSAASGTTFSAGTYSSGPFVVTALQAERTVNGQHQVDNVEIQPPSGIQLTPGTYATYDGQNPWRVQITHDGSGGCASALQPTQGGAPDPAPSSSETCSGTPAVP